jgi:hypothetical protein
VHLLRGETAEAAATAGECPLRDSVPADGVHRRAEAPALRWSDATPNVTRTLRLQQLAKTAGCSGRVERDVLCDAVDGEVDMGTNAAFVTEPAHGWQPLPAGLSALTRSGPTMCTQIAVPDLQSSAPAVRSAPPVGDGLSGLESRVLAALQKLLALCLQAPGVDLIDTGPDPGTGSMALQVHVRNAASRFRLGPFEAIDGIPVRVIVTEADLFA